MGFYKYKHDWCGMEQQIHLPHEDKNDVVIVCYRCGRGVNATLIRDNSIKTGEADGMTGVLRHD